MKVDSFSQRFITLLMVACLVGMGWGSSPTAVHRDSQSSFQEAEHSQTNSQDEAALLVPGPPTEGPCQQGCSHGRRDGEDAGDPISANAGAYHFNLPLLALGGPMNLGFTLYYESDFTQLNGGIASVPEAFWWSPLEYLQYAYNLPALGGAFASAQIYNGDAVSFKQVSGQWAPTMFNDFGYVDNVYPTRWLLQETTDYFYLMDPVGQQVHIFKKVIAPFDVVTGLARIERIVDRNGNQLIYTYTNSTFPQLSRVEDGLGRSLDFTYQLVGLQTALVRVTDQAGRQINFTHEANGADNGNEWTLRSVTDPANQTTTFRYTTVGETQNLITRIERPQGNAPYSQTYATQTLNGNDVARVTSQQDAYSNTMTLAYGPAAYRVTESHSDGTTVGYEHYSHHGLPKSVTDATGQTIQFGRDQANNRITSITDRLGNTTRMTYHQETGKLASYTDAEGRTTHLDYTAQGQIFTNPLSPTETVTFTFYDLTHIARADGGRDDFTYDARGNVTTYTDGAGKAWRTRGQVLTITNPIGGVATYTYNADATLATSADSDVGTTSFAYDTFKRLISVTRPDRSTARFTYDRNDRLLTLTDERGQTTTFTYDANGNLATVRDPLNQTYTYAYDLMDRVTTRTDSLGQRSTYAYDVRGRLASITNRNGHTTTLRYNSRGWLTGLTDPTGQTWPTDYDDEGVPTAFTTPLGFRTTFQTNKLGRTTRITDPLGAQADLTYDALGRLTSATDRMDCQTSYAYDATGWLTSVTRPVIGTATYTRNDLGQLIRISDLRGKPWELGYSSMGRLTSHTDPLGNRRTLNYDQQGRVQQITYPGVGQVANLSYDAASNVTRIAYSGGPRLDFTYDEAGRLLTANDLRLTYDARGDLINSQDGAVSFGASFDAGRRLSTATYDGQATVSYSYDAQDLLTRVSDSLSGAWMEFGYDADGRLTEIRRSNGVTTTYSYDQAGRVIRIQDGTRADQQYTLNAEGEPIQAMMNVPLGGGTIGYSYDEADRLTGADYGGGNRLTYGYDSAGNLVNRTGRTPLTPVGQVVNLSYDDASRIASPGYACDVRGRQTPGPGQTFTYDGASRLSAITASGTTATFTYNGLDDLRTRTVSGTSTTYYHNYALGLSPIVAEREGASYKRFYIRTPDGRLLYSIDAATNQVRFYHFDRIGSTLSLTDGAGAVSDAYVYDPYGNLLGAAGASDQPFTYVRRYGVRREPVGGLYDMRARTYDPTTARFLTRDPIWPVLSQPQSLNPYQYAYQNPSRYIDPRGTEIDWESWLQQYLLNYLDTGVFNALAGQPTGPWWMDASDAVLQMHNQQADDVSSRALALGPGWDTLYTPFVRDLTPQELDELEQIVAAEERRRAQQNAPDPLAPFDAELSLFYAAQEALAQWHTEQANKLYNPQDWPTGWGDVAWLNRPPASSGEPTTASTAAITHPTSTPRRPNQQAHHRHQRPIREADRRGHNRVLHKVGAVDAEIRLGIFSSSESVFVETLLRIPGRGLLCNEVNMRSQIPPMSIDGIRTQSV